METAFRAQDLPVRERFDAWFQMTRQSLLSSVISSDHAADFRASLRALDLGVVQVSAIAVPPMSSRRTPRLIRQSDPGLYQVGLSLRGSQHLVHGGRSTVLGHRDMVLYDSSLPFEATVTTGGGLGRLVVVQFPKSLLRIPRSSADRLLAVPLPGRDGIGELTSRFITGLLTGTAPDRPADAARLGNVLLDLLNALLAHHADAEPAIPPEARRRTLTMAVRSFILRRLHDPELTVPAIAAAHHISVRYLHRLFQDQGTTVAAWVREQRLDRCRRDLADPALGAQPIHAIAARWGFTHPADFSRAFRAAHGMPPRDYRALALRTRECTDR